MEVLLQKLLKSPIDAAVLLWNFVIAPRADGYGYTVISFLNIVLIYIFFTNLKALRVLSTGSFVFLPLWARHVFSGKTVDNKYWIIIGPNMSPVLPPASHQVAGAPPQSGGSVGGNFSDDTEMS